MKLTLIPFALVALAASSASADVQLRRDTVVKVSFDSTVSLRNNQEGDTFTATVTDGPDLPVGSKFLGRVEEIHRADDRHPAYMNLRFEAVRLGNGETFSVRAVPVKLDYVRRDADGRFRVDQPKVRKENYVLGGLLGGTLLGAILHKPFEGAFVGVLAGILVGESSSVDSADGIVVRRGAQMGALIQEDVRSVDGVRNDYQSANNDDDPFGRHRGASGDDPFAKPSAPAGNDDPFGRPSANNGDNPFGHPTASGGDNPFGRSNTNAGNNSDDDPYGFNHRRDPDSARRATIMVEDKTIVFTRDQRPYWSDKVLMVPLKSFASQVKLNVDEANDGHVMYLTNDDVEVRVELGAPNFRLNGRRSNLVKAVESRNGVLYGPVDLFSQMHVGTVRINGTKLEKPA